MFCIPFKGLRAFIFHKQPPFFFTKKDGCNFYSILSPSPLGEGWGEVYFTNLVALPLIRIM
jgi:hypothetical protein